MLTGLKRRSAAEEGVFDTGFGYALTYEQQGEGTERVLFIMGFLCNRAYWGNCIEQLHSQYPGKYTTVTYDQRGMGSSTDALWPKTSSKTLARDILGLLLHLNWMDRKIPVHLVGWSMGGFASIEFLATLITELNHTLNICSLTLANTGHKFTFPSAKGVYHISIALIKGTIGFFTKGHSLIVNALKLHFSDKFLTENFEALYQDYARTKSPFTKPLYLQLRSLLGHTRAVLTHHVDPNQMALIRDSGLPIHAVVSTEDVLIHPTASINLANSLKCDFAYLPGGHMSHFEHMNLFVQNLVTLWDKGLALKFPHLTRPPGGAFGSAPDFTRDEIILPKPLRSWPSDVDVKFILRKLMTRMDTNLFWDISRLKHPGRLIVLPILLIPFLLRAIRRIKVKQGSLAGETALVLYLLILLVVAQETARISG